MPGATGKGYPYPLPTDPINAYPALGQQLATVIDGHGHGQGEIAGLPEALRARLASPYPQSSQLVMLMDRANTVCDANGHARVNYATSMPTTLAVLVTPLPADQAHVAVIVSSVDASGFGLHAFYAAGGGPYVGTLGLSYLAIGSA